jgi:hypothetical protein
MKRLLSASFIFSLLIGTALGADSIDVQIKIRDKKTYGGILSGLEAGSVLFQPSGGASVIRVPATQVELVRFFVMNNDVERIQQLVDNGDYDQVAEESAAILAPFMPYITLSSNLTPLFQQWMIASYWTGNYELVDTLVKNLAKVRGGEALEHDVRFYSGLMLLEKDNFQTLETLLKSPAADAIYPQDSAARLYIDARLLQQKREYNPAIRSAAQLIAAHSGDIDWVAKAELLCAELYFQLEMPESAQSVLADIKEFYIDPNVQKKAAALAAQNGMEKK